MNPGKNEILEATNITIENLPLWYHKANESIFTLGMYLAPYGNLKIKLNTFTKRKPHAPQ